MINSLRRYHLGCGERLQTYSSFAMSVYKLALKDIEQAKRSAPVKHKKAQH
jgi:hypothetical protein